MNSKELAIESGYELSSANTIDSPGKFEAESVDILYWYEQAMNGGGDPIGDPLGDSLEGESFEITEEDRAACVHIPSTAKYALLWYSDQGFVSLDYSDECPE